MTHVDTKQYGYVPSRIDSDHFVLGSYQSLPKVIIQPDGQWDKWLPRDEDQSSSLLESFNCTSYNTCACFEVLLRKLNGVEEDKSDRFLGIESGTRPPGNDPHTVGQALRHCGLAPDQLLPFSSDIQTVDDYYSYKGGNESMCTEAGLAFLKRYDVGHEWVFASSVDKNVRTDLMKESLQYSPLGVSVSAWYEKNGVYVDFGLPNCHWTMIYGWNDQGWKCRDSYSPYEKIISYDHNIQACKRYSLTPKVQVKQTFWQLLISWLKELLTQL